MINERHMVTGKRVDNGEIVTGHYVFYVDHDCPFGRHIIEFFDKESDHAVGIEIDPNTIQPVAVKPYSEEHINSNDKIFVRHNCPNCLNKDLYDHHIKKFVNFCPDCGQRLDWSENNA